MKYYIVIHKVNSVRINGQYIKGEHFYRTKVREDKLENFKKRHNVVEVIELNKN